MRAEHSIEERGFAWQWYSRKQFSDFVLRLRFKVEDYEDNGGVLLRHRDPLGDVNRATGSGDEVQIQEGFENHTVASPTRRTRSGWRRTWSVSGTTSRSWQSAGSTWCASTAPRSQRFTSKKPTRGYIAVENEQLSAPRAGTSRTTTSRSTGAFPASRSAARTDAAFTAQPLLERGIRQPGPVQRNRRTGPRHYDARTG